MIFRINSIRTFTRLPKIFVNRFTTNLGYVPDSPSSKDYIFNDSSMYSASVVEYVSLKQYFKEISNQYHLSSCVANVVCDTFEAQKAQKLKVSPKYVKDLSRLFVYWNARNLDTPPTTDRDRGSKFRFAFDSIRRYGVPPESVYPYVTAKVNDRPGWIAYKYAIQHKITNFYRIDATGDQRIVQIIKALSAGCPVVFGAKIYESFRKVSDNNIIRLNTNDKYLGGHAMIIVGWSQSKKAFEIRNSWGAGWGQEGYGFIDVNYIKSSYARDFWVCTV